MHKIHKMQFFFTNFKQEIIPKIQKRFLFFLQPTKSNAMRN